ncbi:MAG: hypothetical protein DCC75_08495 [Proteobacteria bacterium]|nr:MAG: hypothetical protein DCC75_08495 [Pseudomonadota bacterium]
MRSRMKFIAGSFGSNGATLVEFALAAILLFGLSVAVTDFGFVLYNYHRLTHIVQTVTRDIAIAGESCLDLGEAKGRLKQDILSQIGKEADALCEVLGDEPDDGYRMPAVRLSAKVNLPCFFCIFLPDGATLSSSSEALFEGKGC